MVQTGNLGSERANECGWEPPSSAQCHGEGIVGLDARNIVEVEITIPDVGSPQVSQGGPRREQVKKKGG